MAEFVSILKGDDKMAQVIATDAGYILLLGAEELTKVAHARGYPAHCLWTLALSCGVGLISHQCVLKRHNFKFLTLIAYIMRLLLMLIFWGVFCQAVARFTVNRLSEG